MSKNTMSTNTNRTKKSNKKSKYFSSDTKLKTATKSENKNAEKDLPDGNEESPYKNSVTNFTHYKVNTSANEDNDFKTPKLINKAPLKISQSKSSSNHNLKGSRNRICAAGKSRTKKPKDVKKSKQMFLIKTSIDNTENSDVNEEHLQLAIALSRSMQDVNKQNNKKYNDDLASTSAYPSTQEKTATIRETLEQYGLRADTGKISVQNRRPPLEIKKKKSRYQYVTPVLKLRTQEDRERIVAAKVTSILSCNQLEQRKSRKYSDVELLSNNLPKFRRQDNKIFRMSSLESESVRSCEEFYVKYLNISPTKTKWGSLLKDWTKIPGREVSPLRSIQNTSEPEAVTVTVASGTALEIYEADIKSGSSVNTNDSVPLILKHTAPNKITSLKKVGEKHEERSVSPDLFDSGDEVNVNISKNSTDCDQDSPSLLNFTPYKNNSVVVEQCSVSLLNITPSKNNSMTDENKTDACNSLNKQRSFQTSSDDKYKLPDLFNDDLFEHDNGICTFENFSAPKHYFDLTHSSSDDECSEGLDENVEKHNISSITVQTCYNRNSPASHLKEDGSEKIRPSSRENNHELYFKDDSENIKKARYYKNSTITVDNVQTSRQSKSLNITNYICEILNEDEEITTNTCIQSEEAHLPESDSKECENDEIFDLTQSPDDSYNRLSNESNRICSVNEIEERLTSSSAEPPLNINKSNSTESANASTFQKHDSFTSTTSDDINLSQESIYISDEELNYSSVYGTPSTSRVPRKLEKEKYLYEFSEESGSEQIDSGSCNNVPLNFTPKTLKFSSPQKNSTNVVQSPKLLPTDTVSSIINQLNDVVNSNVPVLLQHPRVKNLSRENTPTGKKLRKSLFDEHTVLNDSLNIIGEKPHLIDNIQDSAIVDMAEEAAEASNEVNVTPKSEMIIKTTNITPMASYTEMDTPTITKELQKFGLKPLKRQRGVQILKHIYDSTHPVVGRAIEIEKSESDEDQRVIKKRKANDKVKVSKKTISPKKKKNCKTYADREDTDASSKLKNCENEDISMCSKTIIEETSVTISQSPKKSRSTRIISQEKNYDVQCNLEFGKEEQIEIIGNLMAEHESMEDLIFEKNQSRKVLSCRVPLHIVWHNLVSSHPGLRKNILLYEPLQLESLYMALKQEGYKFHIQDLLTFLDRRCITIRTKQNSSRQRKQQKKDSPLKRS